MSAKNKAKLSQEQLIAALKKKRECNNRAQAIVVTLLEAEIPKDEFLIKLNDISPSHYEDVVDERSILYICGYPLCSNKLDNIPARQYQISLKTNKVYDITERKKYCSGQCYKASEYIKSQIDTSPLWLRTQQSHIDFQLLDET